MGNKKSILVIVFLVWAGSITSLTAVHDTLFIASEPDYPPYCLIDENGNPDGFAVDLFKAAAAAAGYEVQIKLGLWSEIKRELAEGKIDALPVMGRTPEREPLYDFTLPYLSLHSAVFIRKSSKDIQTLDDLKQKEVLVMRDDVAHEYVQRVNLSDRITTTNTFEEAFQMLANGHGDAVVTQRIIGLKIIERLNLKSVIQTDIEFPDFRQEFCFAVKEGDAELLSRLNEGLSVVIANNTYQHLHTKWFGPVVKENLEAADIVRIVLIIIIPIVIVLAIMWIVLLRNEVKRRTHSMQREVAEHKETLSVLRQKQNQLQTTETQIRLLLNSTAEGIYGIDTHGNCTFVNKAALRMLKYDREKLIGQNMHDIIHHTSPDGSPCSPQSCRLLQSFHDGNGIHTDSEMLWSSDGGSFHAEYFSYPIVQNKQITGTVITFWDITERKKSEAELQHMRSALEQQVKERTMELQEKIDKLKKSQRAMLYMVEDLNSMTAELKNERKKLELSNKELEAFSYSVSHDLRAPLRAINGFSRFLTEDYADKLDSEGKRFIETIRNNATKMDRLIIDLLNLSRVSRTELNFVPVDMSAMAASMFNEIATDEEKKTFSLTIEQMSITDCDPNLMKLVWQNLLSNAVKYSSKSDKKKIHVWSYQSENNMVYAVKDSGVGFNSKYKNKLFGVFQRLHTEEEFPGSGVGLAIVQRIIARHGGSVWAESELSGGATFYFSLPVL
jgi:PAS domain S-box-containing protein